MTKAELLREVAELKADRDRLLLLLEKVTSPKGPTPGALRQRRYRERQRDVTVTRHGDVTRNVTPPLNPRREGGGVSVPENSLKNGSENLSRGGLGDERHSDVTSDAHAAAFELAWAAYPSRRGKKLHKAKALGSFRSNVGITQFETVLESIKNYAVSDQVQRGMAADMHRWLPDWRDWQEPETNSTQPQPKQPLLALK